jgi:hypothetical protein
MPTATWPSLSRLGAAAPVLPAAWPSSLSRGSTTRSLPAEVCGHEGQRLGNEFDRSAIAFFAVESMDGVWVIEQGKSGARPVSVPVPRFTESPFVDVAARLSTETDLVGGGQRMEIGGLGLCLSGLESDERDQSSTPPRPSDIRNVLLSN